MSNSSSILGAVALGYAPLIDAQQQVIATRLTVMPLRPDAQLLGADLLEALVELTPGSGATTLLTVLNEVLLDGLLAAELPAGLMIEVPAFMAADPARSESLQARKKAGVGLVLKGRPSNPLPADLLACFSHVAAELDEARVTPAAQGGPARMLSGVRSADDRVEAIKLGAACTVGWPMLGRYEAPPGVAKSDVQADMQVIVELMAKVDQGEDTPKLEATLKRDPSLAFKLLRYLNSAAFGLPVEVSSFQHAIMLLGYKRLKRWLALLLTTASKDHSMRPIMYGALRRGLLMEELSKGMGDKEASDEMFICGLFSLLDHMLRQPFGKLLESIPMPERVRQALVDETGPFQPYLELVQAIEAESLFDYRHAAEQLMLGADEINGAIVHALARAAELDRAAQLA